MSEHEIVRTPERAGDIIIDMLTIIEGASLTRGQQGDQLLKRSQLLEGIKRQIDSLIWDLDKQRKCFTEHPYQHSWRRTPQGRKCMKCGVVEVTDG